MNHAHRSRRRTAVLIAAAATLAATTLVPSAAHAASGTWSGLAGDGLWETPGNWNTVPGLATGVFNSPDVATFTGTPTSVAVAVDLNRNVAGLTFDNTNAGFTIGTTVGNSLHLSAGGTTLVTSNITNETTGTLNQTVAAPLLLDGPTYTFANNAIATVGLLVSGSVTPNTALPTTLTLTGTNNATVNTSTSQITGVLADGAGAAKLSINKTDTGTWELRGANTYSGDTVVNAGILRFVNDGSASANTRLIIGSAGKIRFSTNGMTVPAIEVRSGGVLDTSNSTTGYKLNVASGPGLYLNYTSAATTVFYSASGSISLTGAVAGEGGIKLAATSAQAAVNLGGTTTPLDLGSVLRPFDIGQTNPANTDPNNGSAAGYDLRYRGPISGAGGGILKTGAGTLRLDNASLTFTGPIEVRQGQLKIANGGALTGIQALNVTGGDFHVGNSGGVGHTQSFSSVTLTKGMITADNSTGTVQSDTVAFNVGAGDSATVAAVIANRTAAAATVTKSGAGTATLSGANTFTGAATVNAGTLVVAGNARSALLASAGGVDIKGGKVVLDYTGGTSSAGTVATMLQSSYASTPHFSAGQFRSSTADATHGLGYYDDGVSQLTVMYAYYGDLNLDGRINADDYALMDRGRAAGLAGWVNGDINYSGAVDAADYLLMDTVYGTSGVAHDAWDALVTQRQAEFGDAYVAQLIAAVPEPSSLAACGLAVLPLLRRRRK